MGGKFSQEYFANIDSNDSFFDSLKQDYPGTNNSTGFCQWFAKKSTSNDKAIIFKDGTNIGAFIYLKHENEPIELTGSTGLPAADRIKIGTIKISDDHRGQRIGEGAIGLALWHWQHYEGLWAKGGHYPTSTTLTRSEFESILKRGGLDVQNIIVN